jgi:hypothetical protein
MCQGDAEGNINAILLHPNVGSLALREPLPLLCLRRVKASSEMITKAAD